MNEAVFALVLFGLVVICYFIAKFLIPYIKQKIGAENFALISTWVKFAVYKAQQVYWKKDGSDRKAYVLEFIHGLLETLKITITDEQLDVLIEAAVKELKNEEPLALEPATYIAETNEVARSGTSEEPAEATEN